MIGSRLGALGKITILLVMTIILLFSVFGLSQIWNGNSEDVLIAKADSHGDGDGDDDTSDPDDTDGSSDSVDTSDSGDSDDSSDTGDSENSSDTNDTDGTN
jgi:hypothetical protein